ncbi:hypothetical protein FOA52_011967 [Chlamydomonas sp. UWO 241]|nr:hypothetical protein FOA52_011967 [Chlamydomonas sp. UWO 241]
MKPSGPSLHYGWTIDNFTRVSVCEDGRKRYCAEFLLGTDKWSLLVFPWGKGNNPVPVTQSRDVGVFLYSVDDDVHNGLRSPSAAFAIHIYNQLVPGKKLIKETEHMFTASESDWGFQGYALHGEIVDPTNCWLVNDRLILSIDVTVAPEDRAQLDAGGMPCDVTLKLPCGVEMPSVGLFLQSASPFFREALQDMHGTAPIPVDGSPGTWTYILSDLYPLHDAPALSLGIVHMLPVVHKYNFTKLLTRLLTFIKDNSEELLSYKSSPDVPFQPSSSYVITWLALAEHLQLDDLRELCIGMLHTMSSRVARDARPEGGSAS